MFGREGDANTMARMSRTVGGPVQLVRGGGRSNGHIGGTGGHEGGVNSADEERES